MTNTLWAHQERIANFILAKEYGFIWAGMRSGKTLSALTAAYRGEFRRVLIVTKKRAVKNVWEYEARKWGFERVGMVVWTPDEKWTVAQVENNLAIDMKIQDDNNNFQLVVVLNYDKIYREPLFSLLKAANFELMILDESHKAKSHNGQASNALFDLGRRIPRRFEMTGTPMSNGPMDMYGQLRILHPKLVEVDPKRRGFGVYREYYCYLKPVRGAAPGVVQIDGYKNMEQFNSVMNSVTLRIKTEEVLDLPDKIETERFVTLSTSTRKLYNTFKKETIAEVNGGVITASNILVKNLRLHQLLGGFVKADNASIYNLIDGSKLDELIDIMDEVEPGEPIIVVANYKPEIDAIRLELIKNDYTVSSLTGQVDQLQEWQAGKTQVLVMQISTGAEGLSLVRAKRMIFYSVNYNLGVFEQVKARIAGPEQPSKTVYYDYIKATGTIEVAIYDALQKKLNLSDAVLAAILEDDEKHEYSIIR